MDRQTFGRSKFPRFNAVTFHRHLKLHTVTQKLCVACGFDPIKRHRPTDDEKVLPPETWQERFKRHKDLTGPGHDNTCVHPNCQEVFETWKQHCDHVKIEHAGIFKFKCGFCEKLFDNESALECHLRIAHNSKTNFGNICHKCGKSFSNKESLYGHIKYVHTPPEEMESECVCDICGKTFATEQSLKRHVRHVHELANLTTTCNECGKVFKTAGANRKLKNHVLAVHTPEDQKPFSCDICGKRYINRDALRKHEKIHENRRSHRCRFCGIGFNDRSNMMAHEKKNCSKRI